MLDKYTKKWQKMMVESFDIGGQEEIDEEYMKRVFEERGEEYEKFFTKALEKTKHVAIADMPKPPKKKFFGAVDKAWQSKQEKQTAKEKTKKEQVGDTELSIRDKVYTPDGEGEIINIKNDGETIIVDLNDGGTGTFQSFQVKKLGNEQVGSGGEFGHVKDLWKFTPPNVKEGEMAPWRQQYGQGRLKTDFADTVATNEYSPSGQGQTSANHFMEQGKEDENPWAVESARRGKGYYQESTLDESAPPNFPKKLYNKIKSQYPGNAQAAYATMWKIHNKMEERVIEMQSNVDKANPSDKDDKCPECGQSRPDDERVKTGMKCARCAYGQPGLDETSATAGISQGAGSPQVANWGKGTSKAGSDKMRKTSEKSGYTLTGGKIDTPDPL